MKPFSLIALFLAGMLWGAFLAGIIETRIYWHKGPAIQIENTYGIDRNGYYNCNEDDC